ncbi:hypothetical protein M0R45_014904 [Rubus argutus]|uniref:RING-type E3 ubiquitin transferase n=1 Tax=Rubus argutus TaxID=59490 RepID=A0AAW1XP52_RUBAR
MPIFKKNLIFFFVFITFSLKSVPFSTSAALVSFANLCASLPSDHSTPEIYSGVNSTVHRLTGFYYASDGSNILSQNSTYGEVQNSIVFRFWYDESTDAQGLFMVQGSLEFPRDTTYFLVGNSTSSRQATDFTSESVSYGQGSTSFKLNGIWSETSGELCMVGSGSGYSQQVLIRQFELKYPSHCVSAKKCSPLAVSYLSRAVSLRNIECLKDKQRLRILVDFASGSIWHQRPFNASTTLVGEGSWDAKKNQLCVVACRFLNATNSLNASHVGDCSTRLSFWFPARWTIGNTSSIVGEIWSNKTTAESDYFENITFESERKIANDNNNIYPHPFSYDMRFHISAWNSTGEEIAWGISVPLSVGNQLYYPFSYSIEDGTEEYFLGSVRPPVSFTYNQSNPHKISYRISIKAIGEVQLPNGFYILNEFYEMVISAEGMYDDTDGSLCMVGCRYLGTNRHQQSTSDSVDCNIVVNFQFPPTNPKSGYPSFIKGSIKSTRKKSDPLYFEQVNLTSAAGYTYEAERSIWRMDLEIILVLISNKLASVFGALQLFHVKRHPDVLPSISICMLNILALGYIIPLMLNFDAMLTPHSSQNLFLGSNGWHEFNELVVRVLTMVGFLLQIRLLQLTKSARSANGNQKELWAVEKLALFVALPVYVAGSLVALLMMNWRRRDYIVEMASSYQGLDILGTVLKTCAGLLLDAFLLPQILLNIFCKSNKNALTVSFYTGTTFVRVLPHAYDLYRAHTSSHDHLNESYIYASPAAYFYSTTWNVIIPCGGVLFAMIISLQQRFGGRCILPSKLREFGVYEKVTIVGEAS